MTRILTGIQSTGVPHLGNILGAIRPSIELSKEKNIESFFFIADMHSLTTIKNPDILKHNTYSVAAAWLSFDFDIDNNLFYRQSDLPEVTELSWYLSCVAPYPMLANAHSFKDKSNHLHSVNTGLFYYPILMSADILLYNANIVPVGKDQKQHLEITRDIANSFNNKYGNVLVVPEARITNNANIPGTDGNKMSKSYNNFIDIFLSENELKKQIMGIITDSISLEDPKNPETCNVFNIYKTIAGQNDIQTLREKYINGNFGYGNAKKMLFELILEKFKSNREKFNEYINDLDYIDTALKRGAEKARDTANDTLNKVRSAVGYKKLSYKKI
ncbi:tryptophan--tRNA ligase [Ichthyobacterium seriolicida]|uniref:Tryptophan--tRNA ligase n=1 Tax=Ichthyobacterium seriolicida TaxID=242600 RepID=A0A1J1DYG2_9FLAO|nr:tryptophan--tRNA ligase [Ichthyobacterium seriolicida]BAV94935.1 tryptophanyl-tRNA synthetase [Ichthyobacterium seriolicida]